MTVRRPSTLNERDEDASSAERTLWLSVVRQALDDATLAKAAISGVARAQARAWLTGMGKDFREVCALAGLCADTVREHAERVIAAATDEPKPQAHHVGPITYCGQTLTAEQWGKAFGLLGMTIRQRLKAGWSVERALTTPADVRRSRRDRRPHADRGVARAWSDNAGTGASPTAQISG